MHLRLVIAFLLSLVALSLPTPAQCRSVFSVWHFSVQRDMGQSTVSSIMQDSLGLMWFAGFNGLVRYDGYDFETFGINPSDSIHLSNHRLTNLHLLHDDNIVCTTYDNNYFLFDTRQLRFTDQLDSLPLADIAPTPTTHGPTPASSGLITSPEALSPDLQRAIRRMNVQGTYRFFAFSSPDGVMHIQLPDGILYAYNSQDGQLSPIIYTPHHQRQILHANAMHALRDNHDGIWFIDADEDVNYFYFTPKTFTKLTHPLPMTPRAILSDSRGMLWIGWKATAMTNFCNLSLYDSEHHLLGYLAHDGTLHSSPADVPFDPKGIYALHEDNLGNIWVGTRESGIYLFRPTDDPLRYIAYHYTPSNAIFHVTHDPHGRIWLATWGDGILYVPAGYDPAQLNFHHIAPTSIDSAPNKVRHLSITPDHRLIASTETGLLVCPDLTLPDSLLSCHVITSDNHPNSLLGSSVRQVTPLDSGYLLITELNGLDFVRSHEILDPHPFQSISVTDYGHQNILGFLHSQNDNNWLITESAIIQLNSRFEKRREIFTDAERCYEMVPIEDARHRLYFAIDRSVRCFYDSTNQVSELPPHLIITRLDFLHSDRGAYNISWTVDDLRNADAIQYAYRLVPEDTDTESLPWHELEQQHHLDNFIASKGGDYILQIRSTDTNGIWCDNVLSIPLSFSSTWLERFNSWLFVILLILILSLISLLLVIYRIFHKHRNAIPDSLSSLTSSPSTSSASNPSSPLPCSLRRVAEPPTSSPASPPLSPADQAFLAAIDDYLSQHLLSSDLNIQQMAERSHMSRTAFYRYFKQLTGLAPVEYVRNYKVHLACQMLRDPYKSITEIAYECGFGTPQSFTKTFREVEKCSPKEYRSKFVQNEQN